MIQAIVEGKGEVDAFPVLLRRLLPELGCYVEIGGSPTLAHRTQLTREADFKRFVQVAALKPNTRAIFVLFDTDNDCASTHAPNMSQWAKEVAPDFACAVVMARREYEAWFLAALESLRGKRGIREDAGYPYNPEEKRDAKGIMTSFMLGSLSYSPTADQAALSANFDLGTAYRRASSFRKLVKELCRILTELGHEPMIPLDWSCEIP